MSQPNGKKSRRRKPVITAATSRSNRVKIFRLIASSMTRLQDHEQDKACISCLRSSKLFSSHTQHNLICGGFLKHVDSGYKPFGRAYTAPTQKIFPSIESQKRFVIIGSR